MSSGEITGKTGLKNPEEKNRISCGLMSATGGDGHLDYVEELAVLPGCPSRLHASHKIKYKAEHLAKNT